MSSDPTYLAACAEDTWVESKSLAEKVKERIGEYGPKVHFSPTTSLLNAKDFVSYLLDRAEKEGQLVSNVVDNVTADAREQVKGTAARLEKIYEKFKLRRAEDKLDERFPVGSECVGSVVGQQNYGVFVLIDGGPKGLIYFKNLSPHLTVASFDKGMRVKVRIESVDTEMRKLSLVFIEFVEDSASS